MKTRQIEKSIIKVIKVIFDEVGISNVNGNFIEKAIDNCWK